MVPELQNQLPSTEGDRRASVSAGVEKRPAAVDHNHQDVVNGLRSFMDLQRRSPLVVRPELLQLLLQTELKVLNKNYLV